MSSRALRKLHKIEDDLPVIDGEDNESVEEEPVTVTVNPFLALGDEDEDDNDVEECLEQTQNSTEKKNTTQPQPDVRRKKKKRKKKTKDVVKQQSDETPLREDEIDAGIREVNAILGEIGTIGQNTTEAVHVAMETKALLAIERKQLNPDNEMRRIFGSQIIKSDARRKSHRNKHVRTTWLATPKSTWPHLSKSGMSMNHIERKGGYEYFTFEHSKEYQRVQFEFLEAVESLNPNNIVSVLNRHPYHIDSLLQLSEICKMSEDLQMASELIERALYCFECSFHTLFNVTQANCQLDYRRQENRGLFLAIFKHLMFVGQRGCYRTALEFCKLLLSLDSDNDPLCASLMIDFYSLRSQQYSYLIRMYNEWQGHKNLSQLPNFAYSIALAHFHQSKEDDSDLETADHFLQTALLMFPSVLIPLLDKCSIQPDKRVTGHDFFVKAQLNQQAGLQQLVNLYIGRTSSVWKEPEVVRWLECNVNQVLTRVDNKDPLVEEYRKKRQMRYHGTPVNILRHILLSEIKEATVSLPPDLSHAPMMTYDPLPPEDNIVSYTRPPRGRQGPASNQDNSALAAFFRSLLPSYGLQGERQDGQQPAVRPDDILARGIEGLGAVGGNDVQTGADLGRSIETLMEAMRNLLTTIQPQANDDEDEVESD